MEPRATDLATRLAAGEADAFAELYDRWSGELQAWLVLLLGRREDAEDALQAAMLRLVRHRRQLEGVAHLKAYVFRVARNEALRRRPAPTVYPLDGGLLDVLAAPELEGEAADHEALLRAVARLVRERREVVALKTWHGLTFAEIGAVLDCSPHTAASRWRLALRDLEGLLKERSDVTPGP